jgi:hypothetical protein
MTDPLVDWSESLDRALAGSTRLRIRSGGTCHRDVDSEQTLLEVKNQRVIAGLVERIRVSDDESGFHCMCCGEPTLEFYRDDNLVVSLGYHHGSSIRWLDGKWLGDGLLTQGSATYLMSWLSERGVSGPKDEYEKAARRKRLEEQSKAEWREAMPSSLKVCWPFDPFEESTDDMHDSLVREFPNQNERILVLFRWHGSGPMAWLESTASEDVVENLLLRYTTEELLHPISVEHIDHQTTEGVARFFSGWSYSRDDLHLLPKELRRRLLNHSLAFEDDLLRTNAQNAFGM